uniref:Uncharacterized protein n=1 Tax=Fagus sylvatica TaxID=28930 RepID=A0A2N9GIT1_FAGSY
MAATNNLWNDDVLDDELESDDDVELDDEIESDDDVELDDELESDDDVELDDELDSDDDVELDDDELDSDDDVELDDDELENLDDDEELETKLVKEIGSMVKALSARVFIRVFEVCWSLVLIPPNGGSRNHHRPVCVYSPHIVSRLPFVFGCVSISLLHFCDSAARFLLSAVQGGRDGSYPYSRSLQEKPWQRSWASGVSLPSRGEG